MTDLMGAIVAPGLDITATLLLIVLSFFSSAATATFGLGGGSMMMAGMAMVFPPAIAVPVHGLVQLGSNGGRAVLMRAHIQWRLVGWFVLGSAVGALAGGGVAAALPEALFTALIGGFILWSAWAPQPRASVRGPVATTIAGTATSAVGMVTGVAGPLVLAFLRGLPDRRQVIATQALLMIAQNLFKSVTFALFGFVFAPYLAFVAVMVLSGFAGTRIGGVLLERLPERGFRVAFRILLTLIALELLRRALLG